MTTFSVLWTQGLPITIGQTATTTSTPLTKPDYPSWRKSLHHSQTPQAGCFNVSYPSTVWQPIPCVSAPSVPLGPIAPSTVGDGHDEVAYSGSSTLIGSSTGSFPNLAGLTSESDSIQGANYYTLQDNANTFSTSTPYTGGSATGWEQFVYDNQGTIFIQYWLIGHSSPCPPSADNPPGGSDWMYFGGGPGEASGCYANSPGTSTPFEAATNLANLVLTGYANLDSMDEVQLCISGTCYSVSITDQVVNLYQHWQYSEFNVFGWGDGSQANFNSGTSITVSNALEDQSGNVIVPSCSETGYTAETNNLDLGSCSSYSSGQIIFTENNGNFATLTTNTASGQGSVSPSCPSPTNCQQAVGSSVTVTASPSANWQFSSWSVTGASCSGGSANNPCQFTMPNNVVTVSATFTQVTFTLVTGVDAGSGSISPNCPSPSGCSENVGSSLTVTANPNSGSAFYSWSTQTGISCSSNPCSFTMPNNAVTLGATFIPTTTISLVVSPSSITVGSSVTLSGSISPNPGAVDVTISLSRDSGTTWNLLMSIMSNSAGSYSTGWTPPASENYQLRASWTGDSQYAGSQSASQSLTVTGSTPATPTVLLSAPATAPNGQTLTLSVNVFNPTSSSMNSTVTIQIAGPNNYVSFDTIQVKVGADSQSTGYYDWAVPTQTGTYTISISLLPPTLSGVDTETIQVS